MEYKFETKAIQNEVPQKDVHGALKTPVYDNVAFEFDKAEDLEAAFAGKKMAHAYSRITNPTVEAFELKMNALENGRAAIAVASGMASIANVVIALTQKGDNCVVAKSLFGGTYSLFEKTLKPLGIEPRFVDINDLKEIEKNIDNNTRIIFFETIANPKMNIPDIEEVIKIAHKNNVVVVIDSTTTTPYTFQGKKWGVDIVIHSSTKLISGGATSVGGVIVDLGNYDWSKIPALKNYTKLKEWAFIARLRKEVYRDLGACLAPHNAYLQSLGLESLALRVERSNKNTLEIAQYLGKQKNVKKVDYPGLKNSPYNKYVEKYFNGFGGAILTFELENKEKAFICINNLKLIKRATNLGDNTTLIIHPASTIFIEYTEKERKEMGVTEGLIRLAVGIENVDDLIADLEQALKKV
ncbi:O-acetylhomoserine aminocarboxypropyltransferase/cysteine synthase family protein [Candidatus Margulisiibacteriota bacterium]